MRISSPFVLLLSLLVLPTIAGVPQPKQAAIATAHPLATAAGFEILAMGGNAFDAAVAVSAALAVVEPAGSGLGGGGFWLIHRAADQRSTMIDGRETAPRAATRDMYLDATGSVIRNRSREGPLAAGIPGLPAALDHLARHYGTLPLSTSLKPAIRLASNGFAVSPLLHHALTETQDLLRQCPTSAAVFLPSNVVPASGTILFQPELAETLERIGQHGRDGFYKGPTAEALIARVTAGGGIWSLDDLAAYRIVEREPISIDINGTRLISAPPPSSGGIALATMLNVLDGFALNKVDLATRHHLIVEAMRRAYRDRAQYLGDPDFVDIPIARLTHPYYAAGLKTAIHEDRATPSAQLPGIRSPPAGTETSHYCIIDTAGNRVAATQSINFWFGSGFMAPGTGVILNNEMDDFSTKPGIPNGYQLVGADANAIAGGKRMLSSMSPTFVESDQGLLVLGTPGGSRIISMVLLGILAWRDGDRAATIARAPRFHHQYLPDILFHEPGAFDAITANSLSRRGHKLEQTESSYGNMQIITVDANGTVEAASDPRGEGFAQVGDAVRRIAP
ncbi:MAG: gamma-glutamyltransferase [Verrucomicrobia bacterium]|nr:gamma-glutamyltransferase [Verrucomicrobiota bacterium]